MKLEIDTAVGELKIENGSSSRVLRLYSPESFDILSDIWLKVGWNEKYTYTFSWFGRPIIQLPEDMIRAQERIWEIKPDVIIETGVAHGGSLVFYASLCAAMGRGRVIGIDIDIRPANRSAIEAHPMAERIALVQGDSIGKATLAAVAAMVPEGAKVMVFLDSHHSYEHVLAELTNYSPFVTPGSYIVVTDGIMRDLDDVPRGKPGWSHDNPYRAAQDFVRGDSRFENHQPPPPFNESAIGRTPTHWPGAWLRRKIS